MRGLGSVLLLVLAALFPLIPGSTAFANPMETIDFWQRQYDELKPESDARAKTAHEIFSRVARAAGNRPGVVPRLFIAKTEPKNISLPVSIPDGSVIISARTIDICSTDSKRANDRLAFVLGHELAHLIKDDFWHMRFFSAVKAAQAENRSDSRTLSEIREIAGSTDQVLAKELQADEFGIIYASMAGFDARAIVDDEKLNFFAEWLKAVDPFYSESAPKDPDHPTPQQRAETVKARLGQVVKNLEIFDLGVAFYQSGQFEWAIPAFQRFLTYFPSREVYNNLAACHHQLALKYYGRKTGGGGLLFRMPVSIDSRTRAGEITSRGAEDPSHLFAENTGKAIELYQRAVSLDPGYVESHNNLACALLLRGEEGDAYRAIAVLNDSLKIQPGRRDSLNSLGVAFYYAENPTKAKHYLIEARKVDPAYELPVFNLGRLAFEQGNQKECSEYWTEYLALDKVSPWATVAKKALGIESSEVSPSRPAVPEREKAPGVEIGFYDEEVPKEWGTPEITTVSIDRYPWKIGRFPNHLTTISRNKEILMIIASEGVPGGASRGVEIGSSREDVLSRYGVPTLSLDTSTGYSLVFEQSGIAFNFRDGKVASWVLF